MVATYVKRPVSPVNFEPESPSPEDILCFGSDQEETQDDRRRKRRRVENLGKQYLEGKGLFILTAGLRGPFDEGWVNPWANKKRRRIATDIRRVPVESRAMVEDSTKRRPPKPPVSKIDDSHTALARPRQTNMLRPYHGAESNKSKASGLFKSMQSIDAISHDQSDFRNWSHKELAQAKDKLYNHSREWLRSENRISKRHIKQISKSPTPTPAPRSLDNTASSASAKPGVKTGSPEIISPVPNSSVTKEAQSNGFTPINKRVEPSKLDNHKGERKNELIQRPHDQEIFKQGFLLERSVRPLDTFKTPQGGNRVVRIWKPESDKQAARDHRFAEARRLSQDIHPIVKPESSNATHTSEPQPHTANDAAARGPEEKASSRNMSNTRRDSVQVLPPSTNLPEFEYRYQKRRPSSPAAGKKEKLSFDESLEAAKKEARTRAINSLSVTVSGNVKRFTSRRSSTEISPGLPIPSLSRRNSGQDNPSSKENSSGVTAKLSGSVLNGESRTSDLQPEAQIVPAQPGLSDLAPSGPSTDLLETDKLPILDEGDSYAQLSTQDAILKAQQAFQSELVSAVKEPLPPLPPGHSNHGADPEVDQVDPNPNKPAYTPGTGQKQAVVTKPSPHEEPSLSTQAMIDAISPFAPPTLKKQEHHSALSPNSPRYKKDKRLPSQSPSTNAPLTPSPPKNPLPLLSRGPSSLSLPSFSIAPNGTLTEIYQPDGQQQQYFFDAENWDLGDAIEDAESFLGTWDVDAEAKKAGDTVKATGMSSSAGKKGIVSSSSSFGGRRGLG